MICLKLCLQGLSVSLRVGRNCTGLPHGRAMRTMVLVHHHSSWKAPGDNSGAAGADHHLTTSVCSGAWPLMDI